MPAFVPPKHNLFGELGENAADERVRVGFDGGDGGLASVEGVAVGEHGEVNVGFGVRWRC